MIETKIPEINVDELMEKIKAEVKQRKEKINIPSEAISRGNFASPSSLYAKIDSSKVSSIPDLEQLKIKDHYHINDFLKFRDRNFVVVAYRAILRRQPDPGGLEHFLNKLRTGKMSKAEILGRLRYAPEGKLKKIKVDGLFWNFVIQSSFSIPVLGYFSRLVTGIGNLPLILHNMGRFEERASTQLESRSKDFAMIQTKMREIFESLNDFDSILSSKIDGTALGILKEEVGTALERKADKDQLESKADKVQLESKADKDQVEKKADKDQLEDITGQIHEILRQTRDHKLNILDQQRRLMFLLEETRKRLPAPISTEQIEAMLSEEDQLLNAMYVSFEDQFRGTREDIKERQKVYLPYIEAAGAGSKSSPILDVGCGGGEWLELLKEEGFESRGVDMNGVLVGECLNRGLDVVEGDAIRFLRQISDQTLGAVTGFHIVEHLPFDLMITLMDESMRVLKPGGMVIFETPNPQNILVGACDFYQDPTHIKPLHPLSQRFILEYRGFSRSEILYLNPWDDLLRLPEDEAPQLAGRLNNLFTCARDYAILGYKA